MVIKSDNGTAFRNERTSKFADYAGLRRAFVFPYNAPAHSLNRKARRRLRLQRPAISSLKRSPLV
eukprot:1930021-Pleurochrysis_carterae.AAC.6